MSINLFKIWDLQPNFIGVIFFSGENNYLKRKNCLYIFSSFKIFWRNPCRGKFVGPCGSYITYKIDRCKKKWISEIRMTGNPFKQLDLTLELMWGHIISHCQWSNHIMCDNKNREKGYVFHRYRRVTRVSYVFRVSKTDIQNQKKWCPNWLHSTCNSIPASFSLSYWWEKKISTKTYVLFL